MEVFISLVKNIDNKYKIVVKHNNLVLKDKFVGKDEIEHFMNDYFTKEEIIFTKTAISLFKGNSMNIRLKGKKGNKNGK